MKRNIFFSTLFGVFFCFSMGCVSIEAPAATPAPPVQTVSTPPSESLSAATATLTYDFSGIEAPPGILDLSGFEHSQWGDSVETVIEKEWSAGPEPDGLILMDFYARLAGIYFNAHYYFEMDENGNTALYAGRYYRYAYMLPDNEYTTEQAIGDFHTLYAYFSELYGSRNTITLHYLDETNTAHRESVDSVDRFSELNAISAMTSWQPSKDENSNHSTVTMVMRTWNGDVEIMVEFRGSP